MSWREWWQMFLRRLRGQPAPRPAEPMHLPEAHQVSATLMGQAAELQRLKATPAYRRIEAEAALREYEYTRQGDGGA